VAFRRLVEKNPRQLDVQLGLAEALARLERYAEAREAYAAALAIAPEMHGEIGLALARVCLVLGRSGELEVHARAGLAVDPAQGRELLAWAALGRSDAAAAETEARAALALAPASPGASLALAEALVRRSRRGEALAVLEDARALAKEPVRGLEFARGDLLARLGRNREAVAAFEAEIRAFPTNAEAYARLAIVYAVDGRTRAEVSRLIDAMHAAVPGPRTAALAARTFASIGDAAQAERWQRRAAAGR
jgi:tetratricopeptide (TPR) repeat protein